MAQRYLSAVVMSEWRISLLSEKRPGLPCRAQEVEEERKLKEVAEMGF